ncbi:uncharacterized protein PHACADRAFT_139651 [Phanerochaete carnosa HHB-10118-sp]|uniref:Cytochrome P450 n=1 Tax=Phanerochaete carnosa (strain HHB-10118-sp) TaxID=650164 RepID=K5X5C1_PHACS|nr:uncharacterized protein PHACADRAFT_139651 [Phanerochaete carnosa HHB-10118-sp]EKM58057.1 hypothetical protein PHACADRAFT_139651 [Phanerochaete carnosa HHB-10118-sp]
MFVVSTAKLMNDVSDDKKFFKNINGPLFLVRNAVGDGLFTAYNEEPNWSLAHRLLMPAFGTASIRGMFPDMVDIASQLVLKWDRFGPKHRIDPAEDFTRLTFDTIALCAMSYRLNSFYRESSHSFIQSMGDFLVECNLRANRPGLLTSVMMQTNAKYDSDIKTLTGLADEIIAERRRNPTDKKDLLNIMLYSKDPKTGEMLSDLNIRNNLLTFLIAGHETTSGLLTFALYHLIKNPEAMRKAYEEVDNVLGDRQIQFPDIGKLKYIDAVLRETMRLTPSTPMRTIRPFEDITIGGGKYFVSKDHTVVINTIVAQRDPTVWGEDSNEFHPERMLDGKFEALPPNAWQPFGFGMRACIGRPFAWQEVLIVFAILLQKFDFVLDDPSYELELKQSLTIKPAHFYVHALPRQGEPHPLATPSAATFSLHAQEASKASLPVSPGAEAKQPMYVLYGSNTGTSESFAQHIANDAAMHGFRATLGTLDSVADHLPTDGPIVIVCASFEGEPADNAAHFVERLTSLQGQPLQNLRYAVFGCGHRDWFRTYQRIPKLVDQTLEDRGAQRLTTRGEGDAGSSEFFEAFEAWEAKLWEILPEEYNTAVKQDATTGLKVEIVGDSTARAADLRQHDAALGTVVENRILTAPGVPEKRHIEFELPAGMSSRAGDYLAILPSNPPRDVRRVLARFGMLPEQQVVLSSSGPTSLPVGRPISALDLLSGYVELSQPATARDVRALLNCEGSDGTKQSLQVLLESYSDEVLRRRLSVLDLLEQYPDIKLLFAAYLVLLPSMRIRQYSISSSPLWNAQRVTLTVSVLDAPAISGRKKPFLGVASTYLANLSPGDRVQMAVRGSNTAFHLPQDPRMPLVLFAAGSGLAPMRGFLQERALQKKAGREVGRAVLFFGCRSPDEDYLYSDSDLKEWEELGVVELRPAFSRTPEKSEGCKYVQDRVWHDRRALDGLYEAGAKWFVCGSGKVSSGVKVVLTAMIKESRGYDDKEAAGAFERATVGRFATDIFE